MRKKNIVDLFPETRRFTDEEIDAARPAVDAENGTILTPSNSGTDVNLFSELWDRSAEVIADFQGGETTPQERLKTFQEEYGIELTRVERKRMLGWMDDLSQKAMRKRIKIVQPPREKIEIPLSENPGIIVVSKQVPDKYTGEAS